MNDITLKVGQWVKCIKNDEGWLTKDKWYEIKEFIKDSDTTEMAIHPDNFKQGHRICYGLNLESTFLKFFDILNPLDYNPDEVV